MDITVLKATAGELRKRYRRLDETTIVRTARPSASHFVARRPSIADDDIGDLADLLREMDADPSSAIVRGSPRHLGVPMRRRSADASTATIDPSPARWVCLDLDGLALPARLDDPETEAIPYILASVPPEFGGVDAVVQWSAGAGFTVSTAEDGRKIAAYDDDRVLWEVVQPGWTKMKAHVWYLLDDAIDDATLRDWAEQHRSILDPSLFGAAHLHYTARPVFEDGIADPIRERVRLVRGDRRHASIRHVVAPRPAPVRQVVASANPSVLPSAMEDLVAELSRRIGRPDRDVWARISWAVAEVVGVAEATTILRSTIGEEVSGEYDALFRGFGRSLRPVGFGTLVHYLREAGGAVWWDLNSHRFADEAYQPSARRRAIAARFNVSRYAR